MDPYKILEVSERASEEVILAAHQALTKAKKFKKENRWMLIILRQEN